MYSDVDCVVIYCSNDENSQKVFILSTKGPTNSIAGTSIGLGF